MKSLYSIGRTANVVMNKVVCGICFCLVMECVCVCVFAQV